jgi:hypothetical protein
VHTEPSGQTTPLEHSVVLVSKHADSARTDTSAASAVAPRRARVEEKTSDMEDSQVRKRAERWRAPA